MTQLLPDRLKDLWKAVDQGSLPLDDFRTTEERLLAEYGKTWEEALLLNGHESLEGSLLHELTMYFGCKDPNETRLKCASALADVKGEWHETVDRCSRESVDQFYNESQAMIYELMWWHTLSEDNSPLAYVTAFDFARLHGCRQYLDFGAGVGSGGILFARNGLQVSLADISSAMLAMTRWRFDLRGLDAQLIDLKGSHLPDDGFDIVTAMDVFEHLVDPVATVDMISNALKPGGFLFGRFHSEPDEDRPHHIIQDFGPTHSRLETLGFVEVWRDDWLWGHQVFQKK